MSQSNVSVVHYTYIAISVQKQSAVVQLALFFSRLTMAMTFGATACDYEWQLLNSKADADSNDEEPVISDTLVPSDVPDAVGQILNGDIRYLDTPKARDRVVQFYMRQGYSKPAFKADMKSFYKMKADVISRLLISWYKNQDYAAVATDSSSEIHQCQLAQHKRTDDERREHRQLQIDHLKCSEWYKLFSKASLNNPASCILPEPDPADQSLSKRGWTNAVTRWKKEAILRTEQL